MSRKFDILPSVKTLRELFDRNEFKYTIPGYQRPYEWGDKHLEAVFETIITNHEIEQKCLLGTIQLNKTDEKKYEIIDGQQRLTSFWLFLMALGIDNSSSWFSPQNEINQQYENDLANADKADYSFLNLTYRDNYRIIHRLIDGYKKKEILLDYLLDSVIFVVVVTDLRNLDMSSRIEETIKIFDSLNTTGLPLETKDLFKIKYREAIQSRKGDEFQRINNAYSTVLCIAEEGNPYYTSEEDLLTSFRYWIIGNTEPELKISASTMKQGNGGFFNEFFQKGSLPAYASLDTFVKLAQTIYDTQTILKELDLRTARDNRVLFAKELLSWSGYGQFKNLFYVFVFAQVKDLTVHENQVISALELTELLWKLCSIFHASVGQIINDIFWFVGNEILKPVVQSGSINTPVYHKTIMEQIKRQQKNDGWLREKIFDSIIFGDIFTNTRKDFFLALNYIEDSFNQSVFETKREMFYYKKWTWDVEHILSRKFYEDKEICNQIGNLMYLERTINRRLGDATKGLSSSAEDAKEKVTAYKKSELNSVRAFREQLEGNSSDDLERIIMERNTEKQAFLKKVYKDVYEF